MSNCVVILEDDPTLQKTLGHFLKLEGYDVYSAGNGPKAMELVELLRPDLLCVDVFMKGMNGIDVVKKVRSDPALAKTPVLAISVSENAKNDMEKVGANEFLLKPFRLVNFKKILDKMLAVHRDGEHLDL
jgi:CheY-like chemotaxis protein